MKEGAGENECTVLRMCTWNPTMIMETKKWTVDLSAEQMLRDPGDQISRRKGRAWVENKSRILSLGDWGVFLFVSLFCFVFFLFRMPRQNN